MPPPPDTMDVDVKPVIPNMDANFVDDDDLQAVLAQARRRKLTKKAKTMTAEEIAGRGIISSVDFSSQNVLTSTRFLSRPGASRGASCPRSSRGRAV